MSTLHVGPSSQYTSIAAAIAAAVSGDTIALDPGYTEGGIVSVTVDNLFFDGDTTNTGIHLALANGISTITLLGDAPFRVDDNAGNNTINGNNGGDTFQVTAGNDTIHGGTGNDTLIIDYHTSTADLNNGFNNSFSDGAGSSVDFSSIEILNIKTGSGNDAAYTGTAITQIDGGGGNDGWGADLSAQTGNINIDLTAPTSTYLTVGSVTNIEYLGGDGGIFLRVFSTGSGDDTIVTTSANLRDTIHTNGGNDTVTVAGGVDQVDGGDGIDRLIVDYHNSATAVTGGVSGNRNPTGYLGGITDNAGNSVDFDNVENFTITTGSGNDNILLGDANTAGNNDVVSLGGGNDFVYSGTGIDQIDGGTGTNGWGADMSLQTAAINIDLTAGSSTFLGTGSVTNIEYLGGDGGFKHFFATGSGNDTIVSTLNNIRETISTNGGNDTVTISGTTGANAEDDVDGGTGRDRLIIDYSTTTDSLTDDLASSGSFAAGYHGGVSVVGVGVVVISNAFEDFTIKAGSGNDTLSTGDGDDVVSAGSGNDFISSGGGVDQIDGGSGTDGWAANLSTQTADINIDLTASSSTFLTTGSVTGIEYLGGDDNGPSHQFITGSGNDTIVTTVNNVRDSIYTNGGNDTVTIGGTTGANAEDHVFGGTGRDRLIIDYSTTTDALTDDLPSGSFGNYHGGVSVVGVGVVLISDGFEDFTIKAGSGNDILSTGDGDDVVSLGSGNDFVSSGGGVDQIDGGSGIDGWAANLTAQTADINIDLTAGSSTFLTTGSVTGIEYLGGDDNGPPHQFLTGSGNDTIVGTINNVRDSIYTAGGNDTVTIAGTTGANANDHIDGGTGRDRLIVNYSTTTDSLTGNLAQFNFSGGYHGGLQVVNVGTVVSDDFFEDFTVKTGSGNDDITTVDGDDIFNLGTGNDTAHAGAGTDRLIVDYSATSNPVTVNGLTDAGGGSYSGAVTDGSPAFTVTFDGIENFTITGGSGDDSITTGDGDDVLRGGTGADALHGAGGSDTLIVATGDVVSGDVFDGGGGSDMLQVISTADLTGATLTSIENLSFATSGTATITFTADQLGGSNLAAALAVSGDANANQIVVNLPSSGAVDLSGWTFTSWTTGSDTITVNGSAGADTITGSSQNDTLNGGGQDDQITGGGGNDTIDGGAGIDTIYYTGDKAQYTASLNGGNVQITDTQSGRDGVDTFHNVEFVQFHDVRVAVNTAPAFANLTTATSTERAFAILDGNVTVSDTELDAQVSGGDYSGATLTISRHLGPSADDSFDFATGGSFDVVGNELQVSGSAFATFTSTGGTLSISFANGGTVPTTALVNDVLQHITYANQSHSPDASVTLDWSFDDGQTTAFGGAFAATSSQTVNIAAIDDAPVNAVPGAQTATEDTALTVSGLSVSDADSGNATITTTLSVAHGTLNVLAGVSGGLTSGQISGEDTATVTLTGTEAEIRATLTAANSVHYTGATDYNGSDTLTITTNDNYNSGSPTGNLIQNGDAEAGTLNGAPQSWAVTTGAPTVLSYASNLALTPANSAAINGGALYFTGGEGQTVSNARQTIDVSAYGTQIDAGLTKANLSGDFGGWTDQNDNAVLTAHFLDASLSELDVLTIGGVTAADRGGISELLTRADSILVPTGTRFIEVDLTSTRSVETYDDGYADNLSLTLSFAQKDTDTVAITVDEVNDPPVASNDSLSSIGEDSGVQSIAFAALTGNDAKGPVTATDETTQTLTVTSVSNPVGGTVTINAGHVEFTPTANFNGTASFDYTITDNGTSSGSADPKTSTATASFTVTEANDAPVVINGTTATLVAIDEDSTSPSGATVSSLFGSHFSDATDQVTGGSDANLFAGVAVTANAATASEGEWQYFASGSWHAIGSVSDSSALLLDASALIRFLPTGNWNGTTPALTVHLVDDSAGAITTGGTANLSAVGDTTPYSTGTVTLNETVNAVNDSVSVSAPPTASLDEDDSVAVSGLSIADVDTTLAPNGVYQVTLSASHGVLTLSTLTGLTFTAGDGTADAAMTFHGTLADINTALTSASYAGTADYNGADTIVFSATDSFNNIVATGSGDASSDAKNIAVTIAAVNDDVTASAPATTSLAEDASVAISGLSIADLDATLAPNGIYEVSLTASHGTLTMSTLTGLTFTAGDGTSDATMTFHGTLAAINAALATATYAGAANYNGSDSITFTVTDEFGSVVATGTGAATNDSKSIAVTITAVNDTISASAPATATVAEDASAAITGLSIADVDTTLAPNGVYQVTLTATHGTLTLSTLTNLTFTAGDGAADTTMTFHGTLADINTALATASYAGDADYNGSASVTFTATDSFNSVVATGSGTASSDTKTIAVTVTAANDPVTASAPASASLAEDASVAISGLSIADLDAALAPNGVYEVSLSASHGALTLTTLTGLTFTAGDGTADGAMTFHGTLAAINTALATARYAGAANYNGSDSITFTVTDGFNSVVATGTGAATSDSKSVAVTISAVNDSISASAPATATVGEDSSAAISGLAISDIDTTIAPNGVYEVTLTATHGTLTLSTLTNLTFTAGDGSADTTMTFHGTLADINTALATASYAGDANYNGSASITFTATDSFNSVVATGSGAATTDTKTVAVTVTAANDPVTASAPSTASLAEDASIAISGLSIADLDVTLSPNGVYEVSLSASHGAITLGTLTGLTFTAGDGTSDAAMTFHGTLAAINTALGTASYAGAANYNGSDSITFTVTDQFNSVVATGTGSATSDSKSIAVTVSEVNDAPTATNDTLSSVAEDSSQRTILGTTLTANDSAGPSNESGQTLAVTAVNNVVGGSAIVSGGNVLFTPTANFNGTASFDYTITDNGTTNGSGDAKTGAGHASFSVTAVNDPVTASAPASLALSEDTAVAIAGLSIADVDAALTPNGVYEATLSAGHGGLTLGTRTGLTFTAGDGVSDATMTFHGTLAAINAALATASYAGSTNYNGADTIAFSVTDQFNSIVATGTGGATSDSKSIAVTIAAVNDAPVDTVPGTLTATSDADLAIAGLSVADVDAGSGTLTTTLSAAHGVLSVGAVGADVSGSGTGTVTITGTVSAINATLANNVTYHPLSGFAGADTLTLATNDHGNTGSGGAQIDAHSFTVNVGEIAAPYQWAGSPDLGARGATWQVAGTGDFNHDGTSDILWRDSATGHVDEWHMANGQWAGSTDLGARGLDWQVAGIGDFDNDGTGNVLWRNSTTGQVDEWRMADGNWSGSVALGSRGTDWQVAGTGDFNGDGTSDILWRNPTTGHVDEWHMQNGNWAGSTDLGSRGTDWQIAGTGDFNHDGMSDVLWHNPTTGQTDLWLMANGNWSSSVELGTFNTAWQIAAVNDFNGDGTSDILWRNPTTGEVAGWVMEHGNWKASVSFGSLDPAYHVAGSGDFNHDHNADILWHNSANGHVGEWLLAPV